MHKVCGSALVAQNICFGLQRAWLWCLLFGLPAHLRHDTLLVLATCLAQLPNEVTDTRQVPWRFCSPPSPLPVFVTSSSISHEPQKPDGLNVKSEHGNLCAFHFPNFPLNPLFTQVILWQG